jgi:hypothetical protein
MGFKSGDLDDHGSLYSNVVVLLIGSCHPSCMWPSVVMLTIILHNENNMVLQNFITKPLSRQCTVDMHQFSPSGVRYRSPHHHSSASRSVGFLDGVCSKMFISPPVHPGSTICTLWQ